TANEIDRCSRGIPAEEDGTGSRNKFHFRNSVQGELSYIGFANLFVRKANTITIDNGVFGWQASKAGNCDAPKRAVAPNIERRRQGTKRIRCDRRSGQFHKFSGRFYFDFASIEHRQIAGTLRGNLYGPGRKVL